MADILVLVSTAEGKVKRSSLEVLSRCNALAHEYGGRVHALILGPDAETHVEAVSRCGPDAVLTISNPELAQHHNAAVLDAVATAVESTSAGLVAMASTEATKDIIGALAVRCGASALPDVSAFEPDESGWKAERPVMAAKYRAEVRSTGERSVISVRAGSYDVVERPSNPDVRELAWSFDPGVSEVTLREVVVSMGDAVDLAEADVVVAAGRGVRDEAGKQLVEDLAGLFNGAVGSSRAVVETGLFPADSQIGQTGKVVSPSLYFALGISGAIQHVAGMLNSKVIVAVNKDPDAPIFKYASYGIVGDLYKIVPLLIEEIKRIRTEA